MKLIYGEKELEIRDYFDSAMMKGDKIRRVTITVEDSSKSVDEIEAFFEGVEADYFTIERAPGDVQVFTGFELTDINKNVDRTSERLSITFTL